jgi:FixJ family two-component response regulator
MRCQFVPEAPLIGIVDDDDAVRESISSLVRSVGFRTGVPSSAEAFLSSDYLKDAGCPILDMRLPRVSGLDLQKHLEKTDRRIPIIFAMAYGNYHVRKEALDHGAVAFLDKPFCDETLLHAIASGVSAVR